MVNDNKTYFQRSLRIERIPIDFKYKIWNLLLIAKAKLNTTHDGELNTTNFDELNQMIDSRINNPSYSEEIKESLNFIKDIKNQCNLLPSGTH